MLSRGSRLLLRPLRASPALRQPHLPLRSLQPPRASLSSSSSPPRDLYEVLGLAKGASAADIKRKYYEKAKQHHPDTNKGDPLAAKKFAEATEAYEVLSDPEKRKAYDTFGHAGINGGVGANGGTGGGFPGGFGAGGFSAGPGGFQWQFRGGNPNEVDFDDLLSQLFGADGRRAQRGPRRGRDVQASVRLDLEEVAAGCSKTVSWRGSDGARSVDVQIPPGVDSGMSVRVRGKGEPGAAGPGDLFIEIQVQEHPIFIRDGFDIHVMVKLTLAEAVLGARVIIPTIDGKASLKVPPGTQPGDRRVMEGRGIQAADGKGHQYVHFSVEVPRNPSERQKELITQFGEEQVIADDERADRRDEGRRAGRKSWSFG